jgi:hypothetical protein
MLFVGHSMYEQYNNNKYPAPPQLSAICLAFIRMQPMIEGALHNERISGRDLELLYKKWDDLHLEDKNIFNSFSLGRNGDFIAVSTSLKAVVVIKPDFQSKVWNCETFPKLSFRSICDKFPRAFENKRSPDTVARTP